MKQPACLVSLVCLGLLALLGLLDSTRLDGAPPNRLVRPGAEESAAPLGAPATPADDAMARAAAALENGQPERAAALLEQHVARHPEEILVRAQLAELLYRLKQGDKAKLHFELFIALGQEHGDLAFRYLIHSHSRLVALAEEDDNEYSEHLHRGIGLYLLGCRRTEETVGPGELTAEALFCRAASELQKARAERPDEARPCLYLYSAWQRLGQGSAAAAALRQADRHATLSFLTPCERRQLLQACLTQPRLKPRW